MRVFLKSTAALMSAVLAASAMTVLPASAAGDEKPERTITFDLSEEGVSIAADEDGNVPELNDITGDAGDSIYVPDVTLEREGYIFNGWTVDGVRGLLPHEVFQFPDAEVSVMKPVWSKEDDTNYHKAEYNVEINGEQLNWKDKPRTNYGAEGAILTVTIFTVKQDGYVQYGWKLGDSVLTFGQHYVMPDHDVELTPNWKRVCALNYTVGDVDRVVGAEEMFYTSTEDVAVNLQKDDRFSRMGFRLTGWLSSYDGQIYKPEETYIMPAEDVLMTAVWTPIRYGLVFDPEINGVDYIKIFAETDTTITVPECPATKQGYKFGGWDINGKVVQPGEEYLVEGVMKGRGYDIVPVWTKDDTLYGDANGDTEVNMSDVVMVMQAVLNPKKYGEEGSSDERIKPAGAKAADVDGKAGLTLDDALLIQKFALEIIDSF